MAGVLQPRDVAGVGGGADQSAVGRPPAHVAGALEQVAVDDLNGVQRQVGETLAAKIDQHPAAGFLDLAGVGFHRVAEIRGDMIDLLGDIADFLGDHAEGGTGGAGAAGFDARIECQNLGGGHDRLNGADLVAGHLGDVVGQLQDGVVLHVLLLLMH